MSMSTVEFQHWVENLSEEELHLQYGHCPRCDRACQPDCIDTHPCDEEYVECDDCGILWTLYHEDPNDPRDGSNPSRTYRIGEIELA